MTTLMVCLFVVLGGTVNAQLMRGDMEEATVSTASPTQGQDMESVDAEIGWETPMDAAAGPASSAQSAVAAETINYLNDDQFGNGFNLNAVSEVQGDQLKYEMRQLIKENQKLKAELEEKNALQAEIARLENRIKDLQNGWEIIE